MTSATNPEAHSSMQPGAQEEPLAGGLTGRRSFFRGLGKVALGSTAALLFGDLPLAQGQNTGANQDTAAQIVTAALIAEDLATTFYYNGLIGAVIQDPSLAGPGGTALSISNTGNAPNVTYLRAALGQEITHANLLRTVGALGTDATTDPYQTFYFPTGTFTTIGAFMATLESLENAFIGAYLNAIREFSNLAIRATIRNVPSGRPGGPFSGFELNYFAQVAASILGVECEHRVLGGVISNANQPNNLNYEQTDGLTSVYNGANSAVGALTPFLTPSTGPGVTLATALSGALSLSVGSAGGAPAQ
jgi:Ferritin-like domain